MSREGSVLIWTDRKKRKKAKRLSCLMQLCKDHALDPYLHSLSEQKLYRHSKDVLIIRKIKAKGPNVKNISSRDVLPCGRTRSPRLCDGSAAAKLDACDPDRSFPSATDPRQPRRASHNPLSNTSQTLEAARQEKNNTLSTAAGQKGGAGLQTRAKLSTIQPTFLSETNATR